MTRAPTQLQMIERHLLSGESITPHDALREYGCFRLADVIYRLRKKYDSIMTHDESAVNRFGVTVHYARYRMAVRNPEPARCPWCHRDHPPGFCKE